MNRTLTAAVALSAALGMAGLAHAQSNTNPSTSPSPSTMNPSSSSGTMSTPSTGATQTPTMGATGSSMGAPGTQGPQANLNQGGQQTSKSEIQQAQQQLKSQGLYRGAVDGVMGPETQTAVMAFQREHSLPQTAQLDQQTLSALNGGGSTSGAAGMTGSSPTGARQPGGATGMTSSPVGTTNPATTGGSYNR